MIARSLACWSIKQLRRTSLFSLFFSICYYSCFFLCSQNYCLRVHAFILYGKAKFLKSEYLQSYEKMQKRKI